MDFLLLLKLFLLLPIITRGKHHRLQQQDMVVVVNTGTSARMLDTIRYIVRNLLYRVSVSPSSTRISVISYGVDVQVHCLLNRTVNRESVLQTIEKLRFSNCKGDNKLHFALQTAEKMLLQQKRRKMYRNSEGHYKLSHDAVPTYIIILDHIFYLWKTNSRMNSLGSRVKTDYYLFSFESTADRYFAERPYLRFSRHHYRIRVPTDAKRALLLASRTRPFKEPFGLCQSWVKYQYDECNRKCKCSGGKFVNCHRVRKEFTQLSKKERLRYINAYRALTMLPELNIWFNPFTKIHKDFFCSGIHDAEYFFPWHRWYVLAWENALRTVDCRLTASYWDWSYWSGVAWEPGVHIWGDKPYQLGSDGTVKHNFCVEDGPFRKGLWKTAQWDSPSAIVQATIELVFNTRENNSGLFRVPKSNFSRCLQRRFNDKTPTIAEVDLALSHEASNFSLFEFTVREGFHNDVHNAIGGHMCTDYASISPEFFMHHGMLDKLWFLWQKKSRDRKYAYFLNRTESLAHLKCPYSPRSLIDSSRLPDMVRVQYSRFPSNDREKRNWVWSGGRYQPQRKVSDRKKLLDMCRIGRN